MRGPTKSQPSACSARHGRGDPSLLVIACRCAGCDGELHSDGVAAIGAHGLLVCTACGCAYMVAATQEIRR